MVGEREGKKVSSNRNKCMGKRTRLCTVKGAVKGMWRAESRTGGEQIGGNEREETEKCLEREKERRLAATETSVRGKGKDRVE